MEFEKKFIGNIKFLCGPMYTSKLEGMISDMNLGSGIDKQFREEVKDIDV